MKQYFTRSRFFNTGREIPYLSAVTSYVLLFSVKEIFFSVISLEEFYFLEIIMQEIFFINFKTSHGRRRYINKYVGFTTAIFAVMDLGGVSDLILISMYSPSFKSTYLGPSKSKYAWVFSSLDFTKKLSKQKITIWLIDNLLIPVTIFNTLSLEPHLRAGKFFARSTTALLTIYGNNPSLEKEEKKKSRDEGGYIWERKTNFLFWL